MRIECALEIMKKQGHIEITTTGEDSMPMIYRLKSLRGHTIGKKFFNALRDSPEYLVNNRNIHHKEMIFIKTKDIDEWLKQFTKEQTTIRWQNTTLSNQIKNYLEEKDFTLEDESSYAVSVINLTKRDERKKKEKQINQEAIELLNKLL